MTSVNVPCNTKRQAQRVAQTLRRLCFIAWSKETDLYVSVPADMGKAECARIAQHWVERSL